MAADDFELVRYQPSDRQRVFAFLREAFAPGDSERLIRQWEWKYEANPFNPDGGPHIMLLQTHGEVVALYGRLLFRIVTDGTERHVDHGCDLVVHPAYRGRGLSARLRDPEYIESTIHFSWQNEATYRVASRDGTAGVPFVSLVKPFDVASAVQHVLGENWFSQAAAAVIGTAARALPRFHRRNATSEVLVTQIASFDDRFDRLWQRACRDHRVMLVRDRRYLDWRFTQRPDARYVILAATIASEVVGYMVTRVAERDGERRGYLVDFLVQGSSPRLFAALLETVTAHLRQEGAAAANCAMAVAPYRRMLYRHGFVPWRRAPRGYIRVRISLREPDLQALGDVRHWFLTMGDGDLEMSF